MTSARLILDGDRASITTDISSRSANRRWPSYCSYLAPIVNIYERTITFTQFATAGIFSWMNYHHHHYYYYYIVQAMSRHSGRIELSVNKFISKSTSFSLLLIIISATLNTVKRHRWQSLFACTGCPRQYYRPDLIIQQLFTVIDTINSWNQSWISCAVRRGHKTRDCFPIRR
jgi:hypothetical protein